MTYPPWVVLHVPHDSTAVPADVRAQFLLDEAELGRELDRMTDHRTLAIFADPSSEAVVVRSPVSRLVVDVERFPDDADEPMAARGMATDDLETLGVDVVEGEHPGSTYYAAELRGDIEEANRAAEAAGIPVRFASAKI